MAWQGSRQWKSLSYSLLSLLRGQVFGSCGSKEINTAENAPGSHQSCSWGCKGRWCLHFHPEVTGLIRFCSIMRESLKTAVTGKPIANQWLAMNLANAHSRKDLVGFCCILRKVIQFKILNCCLTFACICSLYVVKVPGTEFIDKINVFPAASNAESMFLWKLHSVPPLAAAAELPAHLYE